MPLNYSLPINKFKAQRQQARTRGIAWELTFDEWMAIWRESGKWHLRGTRSGNYVMARFGDVGPYSKSNVRICSMAENVAEARANGRNPERLGTGRGWTFRAGNRKPYQVVVRKRYIGTFLTQGEAEEAYRAAVALVEKASQAVQRGAVRGDPRSEVACVSHAPHFSVGEPLNATQRNCEA